MTALMLCDNAIELLRELQRDTWLPHYNHETIRVVEEEIKELYKDIMKLLETMPEEEEDRSVEDVCQILAQHSCLERNKRCLLAYIKHRADELLRLRWECGTSVVPADLQGKVSTSELTLIKEYDDLLASYMTETGVQITDDLEPPKNTKITVRVLQDIGEWSTEDGFVDLSKDTVHHINRGDVQHLIRQGFLRHIS